MGAHRIECETTATNGKDLTQLICNTDGNSGGDDCCKLPITIQEDRVIDGAIQVIAAIRPHWDMDRVQFKMFTDGITNKLVGCFYKPKEDDAHQQCSLNPCTTTSQANGNGHISTMVESAVEAVKMNNGVSNEETPPASPTSILDSTPPENVLLVRVYGNKTDMLIDRKAETRNIKLLHRYGFAPQLFAIFKNGLAYEYVPGWTLNPHTIIQPKIWKLVATRMAQMHKVDCGETVPRVPMLPSTMSRFFDLVPETFSDPVKHERLKDTFLPVQKLRDEFNDLLGRLEKFESPVVFAHNDLLLTNIIYTESFNRVTFIDYEYAAYNFQAFDIGNHFTEFAGIDEIDYARYPSKEFQLSWLRVYLEEFNDSGEVTDDDIERLYVQVNQFALAAHYLWTVWALIQAEYSNIDFDYCQFANMRYGEYLAKRDLFLSLEYKED